jgi:hypothetical protein
VFHRYQAFGLDIASEIACPELASGGSDGSQVRIVRGAVPQQLDAPLASGVLYQAAADLLLLNIEDTARYLVRGGEEIVVDCAPDAEPEAVRLFLLGSAFGALLQQRGMLTLHGSAVATPSGAAVFCGPSGQGKSTLAAAFHRRGFRILADDITAITVGSGRLQVVPAYPRIQLWADAVAGLGFDQGELRRARAKLHKYQLPVASGFSSQAVPLRAIYCLQPAGASVCKLSPIEGRRKIQALTLNTYRSQYLSPMKALPTHFRQVAAVAEQVRLVSIERADDLRRIDEVVEAVEQDFAA